MRTAAAGSALILVTGPELACATGDTRMVVYKSPTCGCCKNWVEHVQAKGFATEVHDLENVGPIKQKHGVPADLVSCHTALVATYVIEGHVPADLIQKLLQDKPAIAGLAVPGMPLGSPGMEMGSRKDRYDIIAFDRQGKTSVYASR